jgi:hypothetical protein
MMAGREYRYLERKAAGEEAARWLQPYASRAAADGLKDVTVSLKDLQDVLAYIQSQTARDKIEFCGKKLGYARAGDMRDLIGGKINGMCIKRVAGSQFNIEVTFRELPEYVEKPESVLTGDGS